MIDKKKKLKKSIKKIGGRTRQRTTSTNYITRNPESVLAYESLYKTMMKNKRIRRLQNYKWGYGLEHETHLFHWNYKKYFNNPKTNIKSFDLFDSESAVNRILKNDFNRKIKLDYDDKKFIESKVPFEKTGRKCNGVDVLKKAPYLMPEFITTEPFSSLKDGKKPIEAYYRELEGLQRKFLDIFRRRS